MRQFTWDPEKNALNQRKHGISFDEARLIFDGPVLTIQDQREYGEVREVSFGSLGDAVVIGVVHTDRLGVVRIISARKANKKERSLFYDYLATALGPD
jgi:uncharacterized protein